MSKIVFVRLVSMKLLGLAYPKYDGVVSWSDTNRGHSGTVYQASNFTFDGESRKVKKFKGVGNRVIFQRTVIDESKNEFVGFEQPKKRWIYYFNPKIRELKRYNKK